MIRWKVAFRVSDSGAARAATTVMTDLLEPAPDATTCFEYGAAFRIEAYFGGAPDIGQISTLVEGVMAPGSLSGLTVVEVPDLNWVALSQAALPPVSAGRFTVHGRHDRARVGRGPWTIEIDAGEAFGTAHHATTQGCLGAIDRLARAGSFSRVLDLGCGSAVLAVAAARALPAARVVASDIDPVAVDVARDNIRINGCAGRVRAQIADGVPRGRYDLIVANILAAPLVSLAKDVRRSAKPGGAVILSGLLVPQAAHVAAAYVAQGFSLIRHERIAGWSTLTLRA